MGANFSCLNNFDKSDLSYQAYRLYVCKNQSTDWLNRSKFQNIKEDLYSIYQKLFLIDIIGNKYDYSEEIRKQAQFMLNEFIGAESKAAKKEIKEKVDQFIKELKNNE
jgi:GH35 family endo-1,4-beta-xylanase